MSTKLKKCSPVDSNPGYLDRLLTCPSLSKLRYTSRHISVIKLTYSLSNCF